MTIAFYFAPFDTLFAKGGGTFGLTSPGRQVLGSRCMIYGAWDQSQGTRCSTIIPLGKNGTARNFCITRVQASDEVHALIEADTSIRQFPITRETLHLTTGDLDVTRRNNLSNRMEQFGFDTSWITLSTTLRKVALYILKSFLCAQVLGVDYPTENLDNLVTTIPGGRRNRLTAFLNSNGIATDDLTASSTIRDLVRKFGQVNWGSILLGPDSFED